MTLFITILVFLISPLMADTSASYPPHPFEFKGGSRAPEVAQANRAAIYWLGLIDQQQYPLSWSVSGLLLRDIVTQKQWVTAMNGTRRKLGLVTSRKLISHEPTQQLRYGTRGNFMILTFDTSFAQLNGAREQVILMTEGALHDWRVISFRIDQ